MHRALLGLTIAITVCGSAAAASITQVAPGDYVRPGIDADATASNADAIANIGFIVGDDGVAVIDPGGSLADGIALRAAIRATTDRPIRYVVITHAHPDHIFGAAAFEQDRPVFVGHARSADALAARGGYYRRNLSESLGADRVGGYVVPTKLIAAHDTIDLGGRVLDLDAHATAHTDNDLTIFDRKTATLWTGDLLFVRRIPVIDGDVLGWLKELQDMKKIPAVRAVPGHGPASVPWPSGAAPEERYFNVLVRETRALLAKGGSIETAAATVGRTERDHWRLFGSYNGRNATAVFKQLEWE